MTITTLVVISSSDADCNQHLLVWEGNQTRKKKKNKRERMQRNVLQMCGFYGNATWKYVQIQSSPFVETSCALDCTRLQMLAFHAALRHVFPLWSSVVSGSCVFVPHIWGLRWKNGHIFTRRVRCPIFGRPLRMPVVHRPPGQGDGCDEEEVFYSLEGIRWTFCGVGGVAIVWRGIARACKRQAQLLKKTSLGF